MPSGFLFFVRYIIYAADVQSAIAKPAAFSPHAAAVRTALRPRATAAQPEDGVRHGAGDVAREKAQLRRGLVVRKAVVAL